MTNVKKLVVLPIIAILLSLVGVVALQSSYVQAQFDPIGEACANVPDTESAPAVCSNRDTTDNPVSGENGTLKKVINLLSMAVAVVSILIIIVAGLTMALSSGDPAKVQSSRDAIIYAVIGLVVVALSRSIIIFIINRIENR